MDMYNDPPAAIFQAKVAKKLDDSGDSVDPIKVREELQQCWKVAKADKFQQVIPPFFPSQSSN